MHRPPTASFLAMFVILVVLAACTPAPAAQPTAAPVPASPPAATAAPAPKPAVAASPSPSVAARLSPSPSPVAATGGVPTLPVPVLPDAARRDAESFYRGKTVRVIVGFTPGGGFDAVARLVARHLGKQLPGSPNVIVENQPGASGAVAANTIFNTAPKDGTVLLVFPEPLLQSQLLQGEGLQFDARRFSWLGSTQAATQVCIARADSGVTRFSDLVSGGKELRLGTTGPGSNLHDFPAMLAGTLGAKVQLISGYPGSNDARVAMERGETNGLCVPWESLKVSSPSWFRDPGRFAHVIVQQGAEKAPDLQDVPLAEDLAQTPRQRQIIRATTGSLAISKPFAAPPGVPAERLAVLRSAFAATMNDAELRADAERSKIELFPRAPETVERTVNEILSVPPDVVDEIKRVLGPG